MDQPQPIKIPETAQEISETLADGNHLQVCFEDPARAPELVKIRRVPRNQFEQYASAIMVSVRREEVEAAYYCDKPVEWAEALTDESIDAVMQEGRRLNFTRFNAWFERRQAVLGLVKVQAPAIAEIAKVVEQAMKPKGQSS